MLRYLLCFACLFLACCVCSAQCPCVSAGSSVISDGRGGLVVVHVFYQPANYGHQQFNATWPTVPASSWSYPRPMVSEGPSSFFSCGQPASVGYSGPTVRYSRLSSRYRCVNGVCELISP